MDAVTFLGLALLVVYILLNDRLTNGRIKMIHERLDTAHGRLLDLEKRK